MHNLAKAWDEAHHNVAAYHKVVNGKFLPIDRPCDWCGKVVAVGYIHEDCANEERDFYLDLFY